MPQTITRGVRTMLDEANARIDTIPADEAVALHGRDDVVLVDIRDPRELERDGRVPGAFHCTRGMLEFWIDPASPYHKPVFAAEKRFVFFCAGGLRSALAAATAQEMGLTPVAHIEGGFAAWKTAGGPVEAWAPKVKADPEPGGAMPYTVSRSSNPPSPASASSARSSSTLVTAAARGP